MEPRKIRAFLLRLCPSIRTEAEQLAKQEGISLNQFISIALAERITRMECSALAAREQYAQSRIAPGRQPSRSAAAHSTIGFPFAPSKLAEAPLRSSVQQRRLR